VNEEGKRGKKKGKGKKRERGKRTREGSGRGRWEGIAPHLLKS